jgi:FkbM family methyltransferase
MNDYSFSDIRMGDRVIDIGANCGGFCLHAAQMSDRVLALEPIVIDKLRHNILLNDANVMAIEGAIGTSQPKWFGKTGQTRKYSLTELKGILGGCDFLKCDCEGGEW